MPIVIVIGKMAQYGILSTYDAARLILEALDQHPDDPVAARLAGVRAAYDVLLTLRLVAWHCGESDEIAGVRDVVTGWQLLLRPTSTDNHGTALRLARARVAYHAARREAPASDVVVSVNTKNVGPLELKTIGVVASDTIRTRDVLDVRSGGGSPGSGSMGPGPSGGTPLTPPIQGSPTDVSAHHALLNGSLYMAAAQPAEPSYNPPIVQCASCRQWMQIPLGYPQPALCLTCEGTGAPPVGP